jgi:predicted metal-binding protein
MIRISLCEGCPLGRGGFAEPLRAALAAAQVPATVSGIACMSGCARESTAAFRARGKVAYLFGDLTATDLDDLVRFAALYAASPDGTFADARPLGDLRTKALARIPG